MRRLGAFTHKFQVIAISYLVFRYSKRGNIGFMFVEFVVPAEPLPRPSQSRASSGHVDHLSVGVGVRPPVLAAILTTLLRVRQIMNQVCERLGMHEPVL